MALVLGWDPLTYASVEGIDRLYVEAVLREAAELRMQELEVLASLIAREVSKVF